MTNPMFAPGEVAILVPHAEATPDVVKYQGGEVTICGSGELNGYYEVEAPDGFRFFAARKVLQKRKPPRKDLEVVRWDQCPWQPESLHV